MPAGTAFSMNSKARCAASLSGSTLSISTTPSSTVLRLSGQAIDGSSILSPGSRELDLQLHAHRAVANALADFVDEIVGAGSRELVLGQILGIAFRLHLVAHKGAVALGVGELEAVHAKIGERGKAHRRRLLRRQESLGDGMRFEELLKRRRLRRIFSARSERYQELPELVRGRGWKAVIGVHYQV